MTVRPVKLTEKLIEEGAAIHYEESTELITDAFRDPATTLVVYTPAVPDTHKEFTYFRENGFEIHKTFAGIGNAYPCRKRTLCSRHSR